VYHIIVYCWHRDGRRNYENCVFKGSIASWLIDTAKENEHWVFLNSVQITKQEYEKLGETHDVFEIEGEWQKHL